MNIVIYQRCFNYIYSYILYRGYRPTFIMICLTVFSANMNVCTGLDCNCTHTVLVHILIFTCTYVCVFVRVHMPVWVHYFWNTVAFFNSLHKWHRRAVETETERQRRVERETESQAQARKEAKTLKMLRAELLSLLLWLLLLGLFGLIVLMTLN